MPTTENPKGRCEGLSIHNELVHGWAMEPGKSVATVWLHANTDIPPIPILCDQLRLSGDPEAPSGQCGFEIAIEALPPTWHHPGIQLRICFDQEGTQPLPGSAPSLKLPPVLHGPTDFQPAAHQQGTDQLPHQAYAACEALRRHGGFYSHWYWQARHPRRPGTIPTGYEAELLALCTGSITSLPLNPFEECCPHEWLQTLFRNPLAAQPILEFPENIEEACSTWHAQLWGSNASLLPHRLPPWFRQLLITALEAHQPTVSVILPNWNRRATILRAIDSVLQQTYPPTEILIADDGSDDDSLSAIRSRFPAALARGQLKLLPGDHLGVSPTRNRAMEAAKGDWFAYLDSDNAWHPDHLLLLLYTALRATHQPQIAYCGRRLFGPRVSGRIVPVEPFNQEKLLSGNLIDLNCLLHHRSLYKRHGGFDNTLQRLVDWDLILRYTKDSTAQQVNAITVDYWRSRADLNNISCTRNWETAVKSVLNNHTSRQIQTTDHSS